MTTLQERYELYVEMCMDTGVCPKTFDEWLNS